MDPVSADGNDAAAEPAERAARPTYRRLPQDQRRDEVLSAAIATLGENPEASLGDIATAAGISRTSLYRYFETRQDLLNEAFRHAGARLVAQVRDVPPGPPSVTLVMGLHQFFDHLEEVGAAFLGFLQAGSTLSTVEVRTVAQDVRDQIGLLVYDALEASEITPLFEMTVRAWVAGVEGIAIQWLSTGLPTRPEIELMMGTHLGVMLFNAAAYDPVVAERVSWWMRAEPVDGPFAGHLSTVARMFHPELIANLARLLAGDPPG